MTRAEAFDLGKTTLDAVCLMLDIETQVLARHVVSNRTTIMRLRTGQLRGTKALWRTISKAINEISGRKYEAVDLAEDYESLRETRQRSAR